MSNLKLCGCGQTDCWHLEIGYPYCHGPGCEQHHRQPVAAKGEVCPIDKWRLAREAEEAA